MHTQDPPPALIGRAGFARIQQVGICDLGFFVLYPPGGRSLGDLALTKQALAWTDQVMTKLPIPCTTFVLVDGNMHVGSIPATTAMGQQIIGSWGASQENVVGRAFREWALRGGLNSSTPCRNRVQA